MVARRKLDFAVLARRVGRTLAGVGPVTRVEAGAAVLARSVVRAEVQICWASHAR